MEEHIGLILEILSLIVAIVVFIVTSADTKKATIAQTKEQNIRATLTDFSNLRREHQDFGYRIEAEPEHRTEILQGYLADLERFAVGCNRNAYDLEVVSSMSGGMLIRQYRTYFRSFILERRRAMRLNSAVPFEALYSEYVAMMKKLYEIRGEQWEDIDRIPEDQWILERFLNLPIDSTDTIFELFRALPGAIEGHGEAKQGYLFVPGTLPLEKRCVLAAHADTVFDRAYEPEGGSNKVAFEDGYYHGTNPACSIGADDRAGCAILWALRKSGHSLLLLDGEEHGQIGSHYLEETNPELLENINDHAFVLQLDRRNSNDYKCYDIPVSQEFVHFIEAETGFSPATGTGRTDIGVLCKSVCGANLSVGYYDEHKPEERVCVAEWEHTLELVKNMLAKPLKRYPIEPESTAGGSK